MLGVGSVGVSMRRIVLVAVAVLLVSGACADDDIPGVTFDVASCPDAVEVASSEDFLRLLEAAEWDWVGPYSSGSVPPIGDITVLGTVTVTGDQIPLPQDCLDREDCRHAAVFSASVAGVMVEGGEDWFEGHTRLTITDTTVTLSPSLMDTHPGPFNFVPLVTVGGPCGEPCNPGQLACQADQSCYGSFDSFCRRCEGRPADECACRDLDGPIEDGSSCEYFLSGDQIVVGTCRSGRCETGG